MGRSFSSADAARIIEDNRLLLEKMQRAGKEAAAAKKAVEEAAAAYVKAAAGKVLSQIPVEELNREKNGIRVKTLRDAGYETLADVASASARKLNCIEGIGSDTAHYIRQVADRLVETAEKEIRIRLSEDERTKEATALVKALSACMRTEIAAEKCRKLLSGYEAQVETALSDAAPEKGALRWLFASAAKKEKAEAAMEFLRGLLSGDYGKEAGEAVSDIEKTKHRSDAYAWKDFAVNSIRMNHLLEKLVPEHAGAGVSGGLPGEIAEKVEAREILPEGLRCDLRSYQELGVKYALEQGNVLLGDEMGLGKTVQAIAAMVSVRNGGGTHFLVICPASVLTNWLREITKMSDLSAIRIHGDDRREAFARWIREGGAAVTTYETTTHLRFDNELKDFAMDLLVVDEAHYIKNPTTIRTVNVKRIIGNAKRVLFMTGTALENNVEEMVNLLKLLNPEVAEGVKGMEFLSSAPQFREKIAPVYFRRKREDVLTELPELVETKEWCTLLPDEKKVYRRDVMAGAFMDARRVSWSVGDLTKSSKAARLKELVDEAAEDGRKIIVFSFFLETLRQVKEFLGDCCLGPINGSVPPAKRQEIIDSFDKAPAGSVLVAQIQSGGTGLNIQSASVVILCEPQLKPSTENQAISRAYRMGQTRNVLVYRLLCEDTIDERIIEILGDKQQIFDEFADRSEAAEKTAEAAEEKAVIDEKKLGELIREEARRIGEEGSR